MVKQYIQQTNSQSPLRHTAAIPANIFVAVLHILSCPRLAIDIPAPLDLMQGQRRETLVQPPPA